jgi:hypothetical protein
MSFIDAYSKLVNQLGGIQPGAAGTAEAAPPRPSWRRAPALRAKPAAGGKVAAILRRARLYPTGKKEGLWWEVADENDNVGWVLNTKLQPAN